jgi:hypothetical protein
VPPGTFLVQQGEVRPEVIVTKEDWLATVPALGDMVREM